MIETPKVGQVFQNRYLILAELGRGGSGLVFKAKQVDADRLVAIKTLRGEKRGDSEAIARFFREFRLLSTLSHPHIMTVYGVALDDDSSPYAICEFIEGSNLRAHVHSHDLNWEQVADIAIQIAAACQYAHDHGVIHRDLKPDNVLLQSKPSERFVKILDFGLSKSFINSPADEKLTMTGQLIGTPHYMSPEQAGMKSDARTDIYALGCIIFELLTGEHLFDADSSMGIVFKQINEDAQERIAIIESKMPQRFFAAISQMLEKDPQMRFQSMSEIEEELKGILKQPANLIDGKNWKQFADKVRTNKRNLKSSLILGAIGILLLNCILFLVLSFQSKESFSSKPAQVHERTLAEIKRFESAGDYGAALEKYIELIRLANANEKCSVFFRANDCVSAAIFLSTQNSADPKVPQNALFLSNGAIECALHKHEFGQFTRGLAVKYKALKLLEAKEVKDFWVDACNLTDKTWGAGSKAALQIRSAASLEYMNEGNIDAAANLIQECMHMLDSDLPVDPENAMFVRCSWIFILHKRGQDTEALVRLKECDQAFLQSKNMDPKKRRLLMDRLLNSHNLLNQLDSFGELLAQEFKEKAILYQPESNNVSSEKSKAGRRNASDLPGLMYLLLATAYSDQEKHAEALSTYKVALSNIDSTKQSARDRYYCLVRMRAEALVLKKTQEAREYQSVIEQMLKSDPDLVKYTKVDLAR